MSKAYQKLFVLCCAFLLATAAVHAQDSVKLKIEPINNIIYPSDYASYKATITNFGNDDHKMKFVFEKDVNWAIETSPLKYLSVFTIEANDSKTFRITAKPSAQVRVGAYDMGASLKEEDTKKILSESSLFVTLRDPEQIFQELLPSLSADVAIADVVDPRVPGSISVKLKNLNRKDIEAVTIRVESDFFTTEKDVPLGPLEEKVVEVPIAIPSTQMPTKSLMDVKVDVGTTTFKQERKEVEVIEFSDFVKIQDTDKSFLKKEIAINITNIGNKDNEEAFIYETSAFSLPFTRTTPRAKFVKDGGLSYYAWEFSLGPGESAEVRIMTSYRIPVLLLILGGIALILYYLFRPPIVIKKEVVKKGEETNAQVQITLHLKNRTKDSIEAVFIRDTVPHIAKVDREFKVGTLHPDKITMHEHQGTVLTWKLDALEPYEERIITYDANPKLDVIGELKLPQAVVRFKNAKGETVKVGSNRV